MEAISNNTELYDNLGLSRTSEPEVEESKSDQFMRLMLAQLENQDPLEPQDDGEFLSQLAQMEAAAGISELQDSFDNFSAAMQSNSALQASSLVGRSVLAPGGYAQLETGQSVQGEINLSSSTTNLSIEITDAAGQLVRNIPLGTQASGSVPFSWDGTDEAGNYMPPGAYKVRATAAIGTETVEQEVLVAAKVDSVTIAQNGQSVKLNLAGLGSISLSEVKEIR
ncbi:MAG: flagellar hook assembly protein FlgD [Proteobacteria bacterium]|nr:flagellar hook assembly protein FlgD [Pseudomonadota bacterium]